MAGPQFFTPQSVSPSRPKRRFTLEQANKSLPLVKRVVADIVKTHQSATQLQTKIEKAGDPNIGCELKDYRTGLIDFIGRHKGRDIFLCWKLGEEQIGHWHEMQSGFAGRQPVSMLDEQE